MSSNEAPPVYTPTPVPIVHQPYQTSATAPYPTAQVVPQVAQNPPQFENSGLPFNDPPPKYEATECQSNAKALNEQPVVQFPQGYQSTTNPAVTNVYVAQGVSSIPYQTVCQNCQATIITTTVEETGGMAWLACGLLCLFGLWCGCCLIPFCASGLKDVKHFCPSCRKCIATYRRL